MRSINKQPKKDAVIISVFNPSIDFVTNAQNYEDIKIQLINDKKEFKEVEIRDKKTGLIYPSFLIQDNNRTNLMRYSTYKILTPYTIKLYLNESRQVFPLSSKVNFVYGGKITQVNKTKARCENFIYCPLQNVYYIVK